MDDFMTTREISNLWGVSPRWVQTLCSNGKIQGAVKFGNAWAIPKTSEKPVDSRITTGAYVNWRNKNKKSAQGELDGKI